MDRDTARSLGISPGAVASVMSRATALGLTWAALDDLNDEALEHRLYGPTVTGRPARPLPDPAWIHTELRRAGVTLELLHLEYLGQHLDGYRYSAFCLHYRQWVDRQRLSMRQVHTTSRGLRRRGRRAVGQVEFDAPGGARLIWRASGSKRWAINLPSRPKIKYAWPSAVEAGANWTEE